MKRSIFMFSILVASIIFWSCTKDNLLTPGLDQSDQVTNSLKSAIKPAPNLIGIMELDFTFGAWPEEPVWVGTISFEGYEVYGIRFFHLSPFKEYSQASPFMEYFEIYNLTDPTHVYLGGPDFGVMTTANKPPEPCKYRMNGKIDVAIAPFEGWLGRHVHMCGVITWQILDTPDGPVIAPETAPGQLRLN